MNYGMVMNLLLTIIREIGYHAFALDLAGAQASGLSSFETKLNARNTFSDEQLEE